MIEPENIITLRDQRYPDDKVTHIVYRGITICGENVTGIWGDYCQGITEENAKIDCPYCIDICGLAKQVSIEDLAYIPA